MQRIADGGLNLTKSQSDQLIRFGCDDEVLLKYLPNIQFDRTRTGPWVKYLMNIVNWYQHRELEKDDASCIYQGLKLQGEW